MPFKKKMNRMSCLEFVEFYINGMEQNDPTTTNRVESRNHIR